MKSVSTSRLLIGLSAAFAAAFLGAWIAGRTPWIGPALTGCFLSLVLAASMGHGNLKQLAFTIWIATGVVAGMANHQSFITFPPWFFGLGDREMSVLFIPVLQIIMFAMGTTLSVADFTRVFKMPTGVLIMTVLTVAIGRDKLMDIGPLLILACLIHITAGFSLGYFVCWLLGRDQLTRRTISLEVGLQNSGMAAGLAKSLGKVATLGLVPIVFGPVMNIIASILANWWRTRPADTTP